MSNTVSKFAGEARLLTWDFSALLGTDEALTGTPAFTVVDAWTDAPSSALTVGAPSVSSPLVQALVSGGTAGSLYVMKCTAATDAGQTLTVAGGVSIGP